MNTELRDSIGKHLLDTGRAHHQAFEVTDGADPEWPVWYAEYSKDTFAEQFGINFTKSQLIYCLMNANSLGLCVIRICLLFFIARLAF